MIPLPKDNLAYPVLIKVDSGSSGSGCLINFRDRVFLATVKHVIADKENKLLGQKATIRSYTPDLNESDFTEIEIDLTDLSRSGHVLLDQDQDACLVEILGLHEGKASALPGVTINMISSSGIRGIDLEDTGRAFKDVTISNELFIFGYPSSIGLQGSPQFNTDMPLLRKGIVAGKNRSNNSIIIDCPAYKGNSGGPVIEVVQTSINEARFFLIGFVSQFIPVEEKWFSLLYQTTNSQLSNSGYSVIVPVDVYISLIP